MSRTFLPTKETDILREICIYLRMKKYFFWRQNTTGVWDPRRGLFRASPNTMPGVSDICLLWKGKFYAIEVKTLKGKQSEHQIQFQKHVEVNGGIYLIARCIQDVLEAGL